MKTASALGLAAALAACSPATETPAAGTAPAVAPFVESADTKPFTIGSLQAVALRDGGGEFPNDNSTVAINRTAAETQALLAANGLPTETLSLSIQPLLVRTPDHMLLFDTGIGAGGSLFGPLTAAGAAAADVTDIFISHAHYDHVGGLLDTNGAPAFPGATVHIQAAEWAAMQANAQQAALVETIGPQVQTFQPGAELVPGVVTAVDIRGHTPGHSGYRIASDGDSVLYIGDTMHHYVISVQRPDWTIAFDGDAPVAEASRKEVLAQSADAGQRIYAVHFPFPGLGKFAREGDSFIWIAE